MKHLIILFSLFVLSISSVAQGLDARILDAINPDSDKPMDGFMKTVSNSDYVVVTGAPITLGIIGLARNDNVMLRNAFVLGFASALNIGVTYGMKHTFNRPRPFNTHSFIHNKVKEESSSFPSMHTSTAFATATSLSLAYPKWYVIAPSFVWASSVAFSRMYLGVHYPTDILVGMLIGAGCAYLSYKGNIWLTKKYPDFGK